MKLSSYVRLFTLCAGLSFCLPEAFAYDPCAGSSPTGGTLCTDGTLYVGLSPQDGTPLYTTPCDFGMVRDDGRCTGQRLLQRWKLSNTETPGIGSFEDGRKNVESLKVEGIAEFPAVRACESLNAGAGTYGHTDWYLPAIRELELVFRNTDQKRNWFIVWYWSSTEYNGSNSAWQQRSSTGDRHENASRQGTYAVRCVRRGLPPTEPAQQAP